MRGEVDIQQSSSELPNLLIIDDSESLVIFITELFSEDFYCQSASDGQEGIQKAERLLPDIILCDVKMPKISGLDVVRTLKNNPKTRFIPIILLSGYNTRENRLEGLRAMADDFLPKPFDYEELRIKMTNLLQIRKELQTNDNEDFLNIELGLDANNYSSDHRHFIELMLGCFIAKYSDRKLNVNLIAEHMNISIRQLQRKIKAITGLSPMDLLRIYRLRQSSQLLLRHKSIAEVAEACGFRSPNYFCTCFKDYFNITPSYHQRNH